MLLMLRESATCRLWVAMDRWYLCKGFFTFLEKHQFDWVTKTCSSATASMHLKKPCVLT